MNNNHIILENTRNYSDKIWDIPVTKRLISEINHPLPAIHPIYPYKGKQAANSLKAIPIPRRKKRKMKLPKEVIQINTIINDHILDGIIAKQQREDI